MKKYLFALLILSGTMGLIAQSSITFEYDDAGNRIKRYNNCPTEPIDLGSNVSICSGQTYIIDAGSGFVSYKWNGMEGVSTLTVSEQGNYTLAATDRFGCVSEGNVDVTINPLPQVNLSDEIILPANIPYLLDAGAGLTSYLWSDGYTSQTVLVPANYFTSPYDGWVRVTNGFGCQVTHNFTLIPEGYFPAPMNIFTDDADKTITGLEEGVDEGDYTYKVFPNPTNGKVYIMGTGIAQAKRADVYDIRGMLVKSIKNIQNYPVEIDLSGIGKGTYLIKIGKEKQSREFRVIVE